MAIIAQDNFNRANGSLGSNWTHNNSGSTGTIIISSNHAVGSNETYDDFGAHWNANTFPNDQYSKAVWGESGTDGATIGVAVRMNSGSTRTYYVLYASEGAGFDLWGEKVVNGTQTDLLSADPTPNSGDTIEIRAQGTSIGFYVNSTERDTVTDSTITSGYAGIGSYHQGTPVWIDDWEGGDFTLPAQDSFTGVSGQALTAYSSNWTNNNGTFAIYSDGSVRGGNLGAENGAHWNANAFANDQYAQGRIVELTNSGGAIGVACRAAASGATFYGLYADANIPEKIYLFKMISGTWTELSQATNALVANDILRIEARGTTISAKVNGSTTGAPSAQTDSAIGSGYAGLSAYSNGLTKRIDDWEGGDLFGALVQYKNGGNEASSITLNFDNTPQEGNLLLALYFTGATSGSITSSGWTKMDEVLDSGNADALYIYWKIAGASEPTAVVAEPSASDENTLIIMEVAGPFSTTPVDKMAELGAASQDGNATRTVGPTATTSGPVFAVIAGSIRMGSQAIDEYSAGWITGIDGGSSTFKSIDTVYRVYDSATAVSSDIGWSTTGVTMYLLGTFGDFTGTDTSDSQVAYLRGGLNVTDSQEAFASAYPFEELIPDGDISVGSWLNESEGSTLWQSLDESPFSDGDYVYFDGVEGGESFEVSLTNPVDGINKDVAHVMTWRAGQLTGNRTLTIKCDLYQSTTLICTSQHQLTASFQTFEYVLSQAEIDSITDYTDLRLRFTVVSVA